MHIQPLEIPDVLYIEPTIFADNRGYFFESFNQDAYVDAGLNVTFVQDNVSLSKRGVLRGLHFQNPRPQGKLVFALAGEVFDVAVDIRTGSPTFGKWVGAYLSAEKGDQLYIPQGFAHGFCVVSDSAIFQYKCTDFYVPEADRGIRWDDPEFSVAWPVETPILSTKDQTAPLYAQLDLDALPNFLNEAG